MFGTRERNYGKSLTNAGQKKFENKQEDAKGARKIEVGELRYKSYITLHTITELSGKYFIRLCGTSMCYEVVPREENTYAR